MLIRRDEHNIDKTFRQHLYIADEKAPLHLWDGIRVKTSRQRKPIFWWMVSAAAVSVACVCTILLLENKSPETQNGSYTATSREELSAPKRIESENHEWIPQDTPNQIADDKVERKATIPVKVPRVKPAIREEDFNAGNESKNGSFDAVESQELDRGYEAEFAPKPKRSPIIIHDENDVHTDVAFAIDQPNIDDSTHLSRVASHSEQQLEAAILDDTSLPIYFDDTHKPLNMTGRFMLSAYYSLSNPTRMGVKGGSENELSNLAARTDMGRSSGYGLAAGYSLYKGLYLSVGVEAFSFKENHTWLDTARIENVSFVQNQVATYPDGDTTPVYVTNIDTIQELEFHVSKGSHVNTYSSVNVPLMVGFHLPVYHRISLFAETGPVFRFERSQIGSFVFTNGFRPPSEANIAAADVVQSNMEYVYLNNYYSNWKTDWHVGTSVSVALVKGWSINAGAQCRWMMNRSDEIKSLSHRIVQPGVRLGVSCRF